MGGTERDSRRLLRQAEGGAVRISKDRPRRYPIRDDEQFVLDLLLQEKIHVVPGTALNWPAPDHVRIATLPHADELEDAISRIGNFLTTYRQ